MIPDKPSLTFKGENGRDEFHREQIADNAILLLTSEVDVSPMVIDGHWGTGKTEFCYKLINKFKESHTKYHILYIDAFQADHADNPLMTILAEVLSLVPEDKKAALLKKSTTVLRYNIAYESLAFSYFALHPTSLTTFKETRQMHIKLENY